MPWMIQAWIFVEQEDPVTFCTREDAEIELAHLKQIQPENIYRIEQVEGGDCVEAGRSGEDGLLPDTFNGC